MAVDDHDLPTAVPRHFGDGLLQHLELEMPAVGNRAWLVLRLEDLAGIVLWKDDDVLVFRRLQGREANVDEIGAEDSCRPVFLENPKRQRAGIVGRLKRLQEVFGSQFLPFCRKLLRTSSASQNGQHEYHRASHLLHREPSVRDSSVTVIVRRKVLNLEMRIPTIAAWTRCFAG